MTSGSSSAGRSARVCAAVASLAILLLTAAGCDRSGGAAPPPQMPPAAVTVSRPVEREVTEWDEYTGRFEAADSVNVRAQVSGVIDSADFVEGSVVKAGAPLFVIDPRPFQAEADRAAADVARAQAQLQLATDEFNRLERLRTAAATEKEYLNARYNKASAEAALASAKAAQTAANLNLGYTRVTARIGGRVGRKLVTPGNVITGGANAPEATLLTTITSVDPIYCYVDADERAVLKYQRLARENKARGTRETRMPVGLALADETGFPHEAYVDFINNRLEAGTGTLQMRASVRNADGFFTPGLFARVRVPGGAPYRATLVADEAVGTDQAQRFVLTVDNQNAVQYRPVKIGALFEGMRVVQGVTADDRVVVNGLMQARPGMKVNPTEAPMPSRPGPAATTNPSSRPAPPPLPGSTRPTSTQPVVSGWGAPVP